MVQHGSSLCHHIVHDGNSVCVVVFNGVTYYMPDNVSAEYDNMVPDLPEQGAGDPSGGAALTKALVLPVAINAQYLAPHPTSANTQQVCRAYPSQLLLGCYAMTLAAVQCAKDHDASGFKERAVANAKTVTPLGAYIVDKFLTPREPMTCDAEEDKARDRILCDCDTNKSPSAPMESDPPTEDCEIEEEEEDCSSPVSVLPPRTPPLSRSHMQNFENIEEFWVA